MQFLADDEHELTLCVKSKKILTNASKDGVFGLAGGAGSL